MCVRTPRVCVLRGVLCVRTGLCVFLSGAGVQPFISGVDCRLGEHSDLTAPLFNSHTGCFFVDFFFFLQDSLRTRVGLCRCSLSVLKAPFPSLELVKILFLHSSLKTFFAGISICLILTPQFLDIPPAHRQNFFCAFWLNLDMHQPENGCFASTYQELSESV